MPHPLAQISYDIQLKYQRVQLFIADCQKLKSADVTILKVANIAKRGFFISADCVSWIAQAVILLDGLNIIPLGKRLKVVQLVALSSQVMIGSAFLVHGWLAKRTIHVDIGKEEEIALNNAFKAVYDASFERVHSGLEMPSKEEIDERDIEIVSKIKSKLTSEEKMQSKMLMIRSITYCHLFNIGAAFAQYLLNPYLEPMKVLSNLKIAVEALDLKKIESSSLFCFLGATLFIGELNKASIASGRMEQLIRLATDTPEVTIY